MASTARSAKVPMTSTRRTALVAGIFYLVTFVSIPTLGLYGSLESDLGFVTSAGSSTSVLWGAFLEVIVALAGIGTAVTLFPVVRRQNEGMALGFVATRSLEGAMIFVGVLSLLALVHLRSDLATSAGADPAALQTTGAALVAVYKGTALLGQTLMPCLNALLLGTLLYRSRLVPRVLPVLGLIGAPLLITSSCFVFFGVIAPISGWQAIGTIPIALWEFSLGVYLVVKGFKPSPITDSMVDVRAPYAVPAGV